MFIPGCDSNSGLNDSDYSHTDENLVSYFAPDGSCFVNPVDNSAGFIEIDMLNDNRVSSRALFGFNPSISPISQSIDGKICTNMALAGRKLFDDYNYRSGEEIDKYTDCYVGIRYYTDGILCDFSADGLSETKMQVYHIAGECESAFPVAINAKFDNGLNNHSIAGLAFDSPNVRPLKGTSQLIFGLQSGSPMSCVLDNDIVENNCGSLKDLDVNILKDKPPIDPTSDQIKKYNIREDEQDKISCFLNGEFEVDSKYDSLTVKAALFSAKTENMTYRVSFYKNHEQIKFNNGYDYLDINAEKNKISEENITFDDVCAGDLIYAVFIPINWSGKDSPLGFKTSSEIVGDR